VVNLLVSTILVCLKLSGTNISIVLSAILGKMDRLGGKSYPPKDPTHLHGKTNLQMACRRHHQNPPDFSDIYGIFSKLMERLFQSRDSGAYYVITLPHT
jgi:hypothetical protein